MVSELCCNVRIWIDIYYTYTYLNEIYFYYTFIHEFLSIPSDNVNSKKRRTKASNNCQTIAIHFEIQSEGSLVFRPDNSHHRCFYNCSNLIKET